MLSFCQKNELSLDIAAVIRLEKTLFNKANPGKVSMTGSKLDGFMRTDHRRMAYLLANRKDLRSPFGEFVMPRMMWVK